MSVAYTSDEGYWLHRTVVFSNALLNGQLAQTYRAAIPA